MQKFVEERLEQIKLLYEQIDMFYFGVSVGQRQALKENFQVIECKEGKKDK